MKLGIAMSTYDTNFGPIAFREGDNGEKLKKIAVIGYDGVDLFSHELKSDELKTLKNQLTSIGVEVGLFIPFFLAEMGVNFSHSDKDTRYKHIEVYKKQIDNGAFLGAKRMPIGFIRGNLEKGGSLTELKDRLADSLRIMSEYAADRGIFLCLEPVNRYEVNTLNGSIECVDFLNQYKLDKMRLLLDAYHMNIEDASMEDAIIYAGKKIGHFHASDSNRMSAGMGHVDFPSLLKILRKVDYDDYISIECIPHPDAYTASESGFNYLKKIIKEL
ncbi:MAG: TIM barrel protein [Clostridia bacterium]